MGCLMGIYTHILDLLWNKWLSQSLFTQTVDDKQAESLPKKKTKHLEQDSQTGTFS